MAWVRSIPESQAAPSCELVQEVRKHFRQLELTEHQAFVANPSSGHQRQSSVRSRRRELRREACIPARPVSRRDPQYFLGVESQTTSALLCFSRIALTNSQAALRTHSIALTKQTAGSRRRVSVCSPSCRPARTPARD